MMTILNNPSLPVVQGRDTTVSIARGIGIAAMVLGHCTGSDVVGALIYIWHMPLFFFFSGYFFNENKYAPRAFLWRKVKTLYWPFIFWITLVLVLHNPLVDAHLYPPPYYDLKDTLHHFAAEALSCGGHGMFLGTFWFLNVLLAVNIMAYIVARPLRRVVSGERRWFMWLIIAAVSLALTLDASYAGRWGRTYMYPYALAFFAAGCLMKNVNMRDVRLLVACAVILCFRGHLRLMGMGHRAFDEVLPYFLFALCAIVIVYNVAALIAKSDLPARVMAYLGDNALPIVILHFMCFRLVTVVYVFAYDKPLEMLGNHPTVATDSIAWRTAYFFTGIALPLLLYEGYKRVCRAFQSRSETLHNP